MYKYCGVELSYANFKEYIESHGLVSSLEFIFRASACGVLFRNMSCMQTNGTSVESSFL